MTTFQGRKLNPGVYLGDDGRLYTEENVLAPAWLGGAMEPNPDFDPGCDGCMVPRGHHTHDDKAFSARKAFE